VVGSPTVVLENKDQVKVLQAKLDTLQMGNLDILKGENHKRRLDDLDKTVRGRLDEDVASEGYTVETEFSDRHVHLDTFILTSLSNLLSEPVEQPVKVTPTAPFLLFLFEFVLITVSVFPPAIARLVKLDVRCLAIELDILGLLFVTNNDGVFEMNVNHNDKFVFARLEEKMADVGEEYIDTLLSAERRLVSDTVLMDF
jgi:hypothetical protein